MSDALKLELEKKDEKIKELQKARDDWRSKYHNELDRNQKAQINPDEIELLELKNTELQSEVISLKRKLRNIEKGIKNKPVENKSGEKTLSPEDIAKRNGISHKTFHQRIKRGWDVERAQTEPPREWNKNSWLSLAENNGISKSTYLQRVYNLGWDKETAATKPVRKKALRE